MHNPSFTLEVVPAAGRQILNPITDFVGAQSASFAIALDVSMRDIMLTVTAMLDILCGKYIGGMHASVVRESPFRMRSAVNTLHRVLTLCLMPQFRLAPSHCKMSQQFLPMCCWLEQRMRRTTCHKVNVCGLSIEARGASR